MLRGSSQAQGAVADLQAVVRGRGVASHVPHGAALIGFVEAVLDAASDLPGARDHLIREAGVPAMVDAACVIGNFQRMARIADGTGIPIDRKSVAAGAEVRAALHLERFHSARLPPQDA